jgi:hypothetical protein
MTEIQPVKHSEYLTGASFLKSHDTNNCIDGSILSETGKTSPLTDLSSSSPFNQEMTQTHNNTTVSSQDDTNKRTKSIVSDESSDLSDLDSEAETEKMYHGETESQLLKLSKAHEENTTLQPDQSMDATMDDTLIKEEVVNEIEKVKEDDVEVDHSGEELVKVVEQLKRSEEVESVHAAMTNGKRKIEENDEEQEVIDTLKRRKTDDSEQHEADGEGEIIEQEAENESLEDGEDEEEELTEEQKLQKEKEEREELERQKQRKEAIQFLTEIEIDFAKLRDRLYEDKMSRLKSEFEMCLNGSHPELQSVYTKIDAHREEKIRLAALTQKYELECIDRKTRAQRTAIHQQFLKRSSDFRTKYLQAVMTDWDTINKERRNMDLEDYPEYHYRVPEFVDEMVHQRAKYNQEISTLVGLNEYYGFPTAPRLAPVEGQELDDDLKAMNIKP